MNIREEVNKALDALPEEELQSVLEYIRFISGPPGAKPTQKEGRAPSQAKIHHSLSCPSV